jgi:hypothetical protein
MNMLDHVHLAAQLTSLALANTPHPGVFNCAQGLPASS